MSIWLYTGTPGSGKSYHAARDIVQRLKRGGGLIANFPVNEDFVKKKKTHVEYWDNSELTAEKLVAYALEHHEIGKEGQCLVVIDECQVIFNCRDFGRKDRNAWVQFFAQHRKLGFNVILITQNDRMLDKQIRSLVEEEVKHRKLNNYGFGGMLISLSMRSWFIAISYWYGGNKLETGRSIFVYNKRYEKIYDSYRLFSDMLGSAGAGVCAGGNREAVGPRGTAPAPDRPKGKEKPMKLFILLRWVEYRFRLMFNLRVDGEQFKDASGDDLFSVTQVDAAAPEPGQEIVLQGGVLDGPEN